MAVMNILIVVAGTEGDVRPLVALGQGLVAAGHTVTLLASRDFERLVRDAGLGFSPFTADFRQIMEAEREAIGRKSAVTLAWRGLKRLKTMSHRWVEEARPALAGAELIIGAGGGLYFASALAEAQGVKFVRSAPVPTEPARERPPPYVLLPQRLPKSVNLFLYSAIRHVAWQFVRPVQARVRAELGLGAPSFLGPWSSPWLGRAPLLNAFSPHIVPPSADWGPNVATTGFWILHTREEDPSDELGRFIEGGAPPIYVGFGSTIAGDQKRLASVVGDAIALSGHRAVVVGGWGELASRLEGQPGVLAIKRAPFGWLLPHMRLAVHHCGIGTIAALLRAGLPSVPIPFLFDQYYWARRLTRLGVAPRPLHHARMTPRLLADAIAEADTPAMHERAARLGEHLRAEDGVANAIAALRSWNLLPEAHRTES